MSYILYRLKHGYCQALIGSMTVCTLTIHSTIDGCRQITSLGLLPCLLADSCQSHGGEGGRWGEKINSMGGVQYPIHWRGGGKSLGS